MKSTAKSQRKCIRRLFVLLLVCSCSVSSRPIVADNKTNQEVLTMERFFEKHGERIKVVLDMTVAELRQVVLQPFPEDVPLKKFLREPRYDLDRNTFNLLDGPYHFAGDTDKIPEALQAEYWRRAAAFAQLAEKDKKFIAKYLVDRKDTMPPTIWDGMLATGRLLNSFENDSTLRSDEGRAMWRQLTRAKNPAYRMLAVERAKWWAPPSEAITIWKAALSDEYFIIREGAVEFLIEKKLPDLKVILEEFLHRRIDSQLSPEFLRAEQNLNDRVREALQQ